MRIGKHDTDARVLIIAEAGNNHEGDVDRAVELVRAAAAAGADAIKFQTIVPDRLVTSDQAERLTQLRRFQLSQREFEMLAGEAVTAGLLFLSTPFDLDVVDWLDPLVPAFKVASGDNDFFPLLDRIAKTGKPVIVSVGFGGEAQAPAITTFFRDAWTRYGVRDGALALLHCVSSYPTPDDRADLGAIHRLAALGVTVGYSDHTIGGKAAELAVAAGARILEKHLTLDKQQSSFRDHQLSADPAELRALVDAVRRAERMCSSPVESGPRSPELDARRSIAAARDLPAGAVIEWSDLKWLRPGTGLRPGEETRVIGRRVQVPVASGHLIRPADLV